MSPAIDRHGLYTLGAAELLQAQPLLGLLGSAQCPGGLLLQAHDLAQTLRAAGTATLGGFQSPVEQEMLAVLLRGAQPLVIALARRLEGIRLPAAWRAGVAAGRLLLVSQTPPGGPARTTAALALARNALVVGLSRRVLIVHAAPGGKLIAAIPGWLAQGAQVYTLDHPANVSLLAMGVRLWGI